VIYTEQKVIFINPNPKQEFEKLLPKILAAAIISRLQREQQEPDRNPERSA